jgi:hypothetical protein
MAADNLGECDARGREPHDTGSAPLPFSRATRPRFAPAETTVQKSMPMLGGSDHGGAVKAPPAQRGKRPASPPE